MKRVSWSRVDHSEQMKWRWYYRTSLLDSWMFLLCGKTMMSFSVTTEVHNTAARLRDVLALCSSYLPLPFPVRGQDTAKQSRTRNTLQEMFALLCRGRFQWEWAGRNRSIARWLFSWVKTNWDHSGHQTSRGWCSKRRVWSWHTLESRPLSWTHFCASEQFSTRGCNWCQWIRSQLFELLGGGNNNSCHVKWLISCKLGMYNDINLCWQLKDAKCREQCKCNMWEMKGLWFLSQIGLDREGTIPIL